MAREYGQFCGLARALELVGSRWTLLIVRDLLMGPKRYTDLARGLPGIPTNVLSARLRELEDDGIVERGLEPRPATSVVYALTPFGLQLEEPVERLGLWGAQALGRPTSSDTFSVAALSIALRATFDPVAARGRDLVVDLRVDGDQLHVQVSDGQVSFPSQPPAEPTLVMTMAHHVFAELFGGYTDLDSAVASKRASLVGPKQEARRFFRIFHLPTSDSDSGSGQRATRASRADAADS
jgi:DNA-binding HxlR family transcriptional regulator